MGLSHDIISEFVRITNDKKEKPKEGIVYGVVAQTSNGNYVKIDGSDLITPAETTTEVQDGERVTVMIKDHTATITGNVTSPSANSNSMNKKFESVSDKIGTFELIVADKISANELEVYKATIDVLIAGKATIQDLEVVNATIEHLYAQNATIENLVANKASIKDLDVVNATIENLKAKDAEIEHAVIDHLEATLADIKVLNADFAQIRTLVNGNLTSDNILSFNITSDKVTMEDAFIKDAMIANVSAAKINAGKINTNNVTIGSEDGGMLITGSTQQFVDKDGNVRIQIGRDAKGDFTFILYGEDGVGQLINQNGITASAISDGLIVNDMVSDKAAISGEKLDISSVIMEINNDNSTAIKSNKIYLNEQEQSLEVAFNSLKTQVETIKDITVSGDLTSIIDRVLANTTEIEVNKERINTLILEDSIIKKQVTDLEGDVVETSTTLASKYSELDQTIEGFKTSVADTYATKSIVNDVSNNLSTNYSTTSAMNSAIDQKVDEINLSISETYATNETVNDINDNLLKNYSTTSVMNSTINQKVDEISLSVSETYATISSVDGINDKLLTEYPTITQMDSAITQKGNEIELGVTQTIKGIQTGGRNLIKNGNFEDGLNHWIYERFSGVETTELEVWAGEDWRHEWCMDGKKQCALWVHSIDDSNRRGEWTLRQNFKTVVGQEYTVSYMIAGHRSYKKVAVRRYDNWIYLNSKEYGHIEGGKNANDWVYDSITFTAETPDTTIWFTMQEAMSGTDAHIWFTDVCCVEGNKAQRFIPSLEEYSTTSQMNSAIQLKADEINLSVSNIQNGLTNENLLVGSFDYTPDTYWYLSSDSAISSSQKLYDCKAWRTDFDWGGMKVNLKYLLDRGVFEVGKPYTFSMYARTTSGTCKMGAYMHHFYKGDFTVTTQWKQFSFTFTPTQSWIDEIPNNDTMRFEPYNLSGTGIRFYGACYKLERGTIATPWTTNSSDVSLIKQQADSITSTVSSNYNTLNDKFNNYPTTSQMNSAITQKADSITSTVSSNYNTLNDKFNNYPTTSQMNSAITQKANEITSTVRAYKTGVANLLLNSSEGKGLNNPSSGYHDIHFYLCGDFNNIYFHETRYFCLSFTVGYTGSFINAPFHSITFRNTWETRWWLDDIQKIERVGDNAYRYYMKPLRCDRGFVTADKLTFIGEHGDGNGWFYNVMLTEGEMHPSAYTPSNNDYSNKFSEIKQTTDGITSTVSSLGNRMGTAESTITQHSNQIATKVDVNGVKSTIQQNPESVRIGFNSISDYFDLNSTRLKVGHSDGGYTRIGQDGILYQAANGSQNRYHCLMKQGWLGQISGTSWSRTITLPSEFKGKPFSVIISVTEVNAVNTHDVIKHFKATVPHDTVDYTNGTFVINMSALAYYVPGQQSASAIQTDVSWIAIC